MPRSYGREFSIIASMRGSGLSDEDLEQVVAEIRRLWP
eukprot:COSAG02_NODE_41800_length_390_cov_25.659794_1_plen_37_part_10